MYHRVAEEARLNALVHQTSCNFKKVPGHTYFVYKQRKHPDKEFISMISPQVLIGTNSVPPPPVSTFHVSLITLTYTLYGTQAEKSSGQGVYHIDFITGTYGY
jgi:hypothetical protein